MRTRFVGRDGELRALLAALDDAESGRPGLVLCRGEPGIGKTRLAQEVATLAIERGVTVAWGTGLEDPGAPPYWPWRQIVRSLARSMDLVALADADAAPHDLPDLFSNESLDSVTSEERFARFDALTSHLSRMAQHRSLLLVIDDVHWADASSLLLLQHVVRSVTDERLLVLATLRDTEPVAVAVLSDLVRSPVARELRLSGLSRAAVQEYLAASVGPTFDPFEADQVHTVTDGNPFFVCELGRMLATGQPVGQSGVPVNVRDVIAARLERLPADGARVLQAAAVVGQEFNSALVAAMVEIEEAGCVRLLDDAQRAGLVERGPDEHRFEHALIRDAIAATLDAGSRLALHRAAARALEAQPEGLRHVSLFELARHWAAAAVGTDRAHAARWLETASDEAVRSLAYEEGARLVRQALDAGGDELGDSDRCLLLVKLAAALQMTGDQAGRVEACLAAAEVARHASRPDLLAEAALVLEAIGPTPSERLTRQICSDALDGLGQSRPALRARLLARLAEATVYVSWGVQDSKEHYAQADRASLEALTLASEAADDAALEAAFRARRLVLAAPEGLAERVALADQMLTLAVRTGNEGARFRAHLWHVEAALERGDLPRVAREVEALQDTSRSLGSPLARYEVLRMRAILAQAHGRFAEAVRLGDEAFAGIELTHPDFGFHERAGLLGMIGDHIGHEAAESLETSGYTETTAFELPPMTAGVIVAVATAHLLAQVGRTEEAAFVWRALGPPEGWTPSPHALLHAYAFGVQLAVRLGSERDLEYLHRALEPYSDRHVSSGGVAVAYAGPVTLWLGVASRHLGRADDAVRELEAAARSCQAVGAAGFEAQSRAELGAALLLRSGSGDLGRARTLLVAAAQQAGALGMRPVRAQATAWLRDLEASSPLTAREWEVAALVADGLTNRQIAERLVLSERTAQNHVQHVLTKLALANRSQIATWMARRALSTTVE